MQLPQAFKHAVVKVAPEDKWHDDVTQSQRTLCVRPPRHGAPWRHDAAFEPGKALPLAPLHEEVLLQHGQTDDGWARVAVGAQGQVNTEDEPVLGGIADQGVKTFDDVREILVHGDLAGFATSGVVDAGGHAVVFVDVDQINVR